jgi:hypothetical protein
MMNHSIFYGSTAPQVLTTHPYIYDWSSDFHLRTSEAKTNYLIATTMANLPSMQMEFKQGILERIFKRTISPEELARAGIHSTSTWFLPRNVHESGAIHLEFLHALHRYVTRPNVSIGVYSSAVQDGTPILQEMPLLQNAGRTENHVKCRRDGEWYALYNCGNGHTDHITFGRDIQYRGPEVPEYVDLKIYDAATKQSAQLFQNITWLAQQLKMLGVFEINLVGDATKHAEFAEVMQVLMAHGFSLSFEAGATLLSQAKAAGEAHSTIYGAREVYVQASDLTALRKIADFNNSFPGGNPLVGGARKAILEIDVDRHSKKSFLHLMEGAGKHDIPFALCGIIAPEWLNQWVLAGEAEGYQISASLQRQLRPFFTQTGHLPGRVYRSEGRFSCFIDACNSTFGRDQFSTQYPFDKDIQPALKKQFPFV